MSDEDNYAIPDEVEEWIGLQKSEYLSLLIENMGEGDFGFEEFHLFDDKIEETVKRPDQSYLESKDGYSVHTYVRTYSDEKMFHHIVVGCMYPDKKNKVEVFLPILSFVTRSGDVVGKFSVGRPMARPTLN